MTALSSSCPDWCAKHYEIDPGTRDCGVTHRSADRVVAGFDVCIERFDRVRDGRPGLVFIRVDDSELFVSEAADLAAGLSKLAASAAATDGTVMRTCELPPDRDVVLYPDLNVVEVASRLAPEERNHALAKAGVL